MGRRGDEPVDDMANLPGPYDASRPLYPNLQPEDQRQMTHIMSPSVSFKTDLPEDEAFLRLMRVLDDHDYCWLYHYSGPDLGFKIPKGETVELGGLIEAFETVPIPSLPMTGIKASVLQDADPSIRASIKVNSVSRTKVHLWIKGTIPFTEWRELCRSADRALDADE